MPGSHTQCKAYDIDEAISFIFNQVSQGDHKIIADHEYSFKQ